MADKKFKILRVTLTRDYIVPMVDDTRTALNGETLPELVQDWFGPGRFPFHHASRDAHRVGFSDKLISVTHEDGTPIIAAPSEADELTALLKLAGDKP